MCGHPYTLLWRIRHRSPRKHHRLTLLKRALLLFTYDPPWQYRLKNVGALIVEPRAGAER
jgi:hypothetical protein